MSEDILNGVFGFIYFIAFAIYASYYSTARQDIRKLEKIKFVKLYSDAYINGKLHTKTEKAKRLKSISYYPTILISIAYIICLVWYCPESGFQYVPPIVIGSLGFLFILLMNYTGGVQVFDPNKRYDRTIKW